MPLTGGGVKPAEGSQMKVNSAFININSPEPEKLRQFYGEVVGLAKRPDMGDAYDIGGAVLGIDGHSELSGPAKEPARVLIDLFVDDLQAEQARLEGQGVPFIRKGGREYWGGVISTFLDPDGNYVQLIEYKPQ
jgi:predicted enzyme related to lactoylglutathione lyase